MFRVRSGTGHVRWYSVQIGVAQAAGDIALGLLDHIARPALHVIGSARPVVFAGRIAMATAPTGSAGLRRVQIPVSTIPFHHEPPVEQG
jgi:hypothetical protein